MQEAGEQIQVSTSVTSEGPPALSQISCLDSSGLMSPRPRGPCSHPFFFLLYGLALFQAIVIEVHTPNTWSLLPLFYSVTTPPLTYIFCPSFPALSFPFPSLQHPRPLGDLLCPWLSFSPEHSKLLSITLFPFSGKILERLGMEGS